MRNAHRRVLRNGCLARIWLAYGDWKVVMVLMLRNLAGQLRANEHDRLGLLGQAERLEQQQ